MTITDHRGGYSVIRSHRNWRLFHYVNDTAVRPAHHVIRPASRTVRLRGVPPPRGGGFQGHLISRPSTPSTYTQIRGGHGPSGGARNSTNLVNITSAERDARLLRNAERRYRGSRSRTFNNPNAFPTFRSGNRIAVPTISTGRAAPQVFTLRRQADGSFRRVYPGGS